MREHVHEWFGLTYSSYLVLPRSLLQSMPAKWQKRFVKCLEELQEAAPKDCPSDYLVRAREGGKFVHDPYSNYQRGRRVVKMLK